MKKTKNLMFAILVIAFAVSSCSNNDAALKEKQATIDSLQAIINGSEPMNTKMLALATAGPDTSLLSNPIAYSDALSHIKNFRTYLSTYDPKNLTLPYAWYFEKNQILDLLNQNGNECIGLKLYASIVEIDKVKILKPIAIGVKAGNDTDKYLDIIDTANFKALNMSKMCPTICDVNSEFSK